MDNYPKKKLLLEESIFLRFFPVPLIAYYYEKGQQSFLKVYKEKSYRSPILIWNQELRLLLENKITEHARGFIEKLKEFASSHQTYSKSQKTLPNFGKEFKFTEIVKYDKIESEVRCGRFYLSVWVDKNQTQDSIV